MLINNTNRNYKGIYSKKTVTVPKLNNNDKILNQLVIDQIPEKIEDKYYNDYNIIYVDSVIKKKLEKEKIGKVENLKIEIKECESLIKDKNSNYAIKLQNKNKIMEMNEEIKYILSEKKIKKYIDETKNLIEEYKSLKTSQPKIKFGEIDEDDFYSEEIKTKRIVVIEKFLDIARDYYNIEVYNITNKNANCCLYCGNEIKEDDISEEGLKKCSNCNATFQTVIYTKTAKDSDRITASKTEDESLENFIKAFYRKQGLKYNENINEICKELDEYCKKTPGLLLGEEIRALPLDNRGRKEFTNLVMLQKQLSEIGRNSAYEDANLIAHKYWGWKLPDYSHLYDKVIKIYNDTLKVYKLIPREVRNRKSNLGTQFVLFKILQLCGVDVIEEEFKIVEDRDSRMSQNELWRTMCEKAGRKNTEIYYIP